MHVNTSGGVTHAMDAHIRAEHDGALSLFVSLVRHRRYVYTITGVLYCEG